MLQPQLHTGQPLMQSDFNTQKLNSARSNIASFLLNEGLTAQQADLAINQLLAGNPAKNAQNKSHHSAIYVSAKSAAQSQKVEHALSALSASLEPNLHTSLSIEHNPGGIAYSLVPWGGRDEVQKALLNSKFTTKTTETPAVSALFDLSAHVSKTDPNNLSPAASREVLRLDLHRTAAMLMRSLNLYPPTNFNSDDEHVWSQLLLSGGTVILPVRSKSEQAKQFYEQLVTAALSDAQALRGVIASTSIEWREGREPALVVRTGIPKQG